MQANKIVVTTLTPPTKNLDLQNYKIDLEHELITLPHIKNILKQILLDNIYDGVAITSHPSYKTLLTLLYSISAAKFCEYEKNGAGVIELFVSAHFVAGLKHLATQNDSSLFTKKTEEDISYFLLSLRFSPHTVLPWFIEYFNQKNIYPYVNHFQQALLTNNIATFHRLLIKHKSTLPVTHWKNNTSDLLEDACLIGNLPAVKLLCEHNKGKHLEEFNLHTAVESSLFHFHDDVTFYLLNKLIELKKINLLTEILFFMVKEKQFENPGRKTCSKWFFSKKFAETCVTFLLNHRGLDEQHKSALIKIPVLFLLTAFRYTEKKEFDIVFSKALSLLDKNLSAPEGINNFIKIQVAILEKKKEELKKLNFDNITLFVNGINLSRFVENPIVNVPFSQTIRKIIFSSLKNFNVEKQYKYLFKNIVFHDNFLGDILFGDLQVNLINKANESLRFYLLDYFAATPKNRCMHSPLMENPLELVEFNDSVENRNIFSFIQSHPHFILQLENEGIIEHATWGRNQQCHINFLIQLKNILTTLSISFKEQNDTNVKSNILDCCQLMKKAFDEKLFYSPSNQAEVVTLLSEFITLCRQADLFQYIPSEILPLLLYHNRVDLMLDDIKAFIKSNKKIETRPPILDLLLMITMVKQAFNLALDLPKHSTWFYQEDSTSQFFKMATHALLTSKQIISGDRKTILTLIKDINAVKNQTIRKQEISLNDLYVPEFTLCTKIFLNWILNSICPDITHAEKVENLSLLKLKNTLLIAVHSLLQQFKDLKIEVPTELPEINDLVIKFKNQQSELCDKMQTAIGKLTNQISVLQASVKVDVNSFNILPARVDDIKPSYRLDKSIRLDVRFFTEKPDNFAKTRERDALDLAPSAFPFVFQWYCNEIANLNLYLHHYYSQQGREKEANAAYIQHSFYRNTEKCSNISLKKHKQMFNYLFQSTQFAFFNLLSKWQQGPYQSPSLMM